MEETGWLRKGVDSRLTLFYFFQTYFKKFKNNLLNISGTPKNTSLKNKTLSKHMKLINYISLWFSYLEILVFITPVLFFLIL